MKKLHRYAIMIYIAIAIAVSMYLFSVKVGMTEICGVAFIDQSFKAPRIYLRPLGNINRSHLKTIYLTYGLVKYGTIKNYTVKVRQKSKSQLEIDNPYKPGTTKETLINPQLLLEYKVPIYFLTIKNIIKPFKP